VFDSFFSNSYDWIEAFQPAFETREVADALAVPRDVRACHGGLKNILSGVTAVAHHDPWVAVFEEAEFPVRVVSRYGWCHSLGLAGRYGPNAKESHDATPADAPWMIHAAEGTDDAAAKEIDALEALGVLGVNTVLVHGVGLTANGSRRVVEKGAAVVWCPASNLALLGRTFDPRFLFDAKSLALGTDSRLSGSFDLLAELKVAAERSDLRPRDLLRLVTSDASRILRLEDAHDLRVGDRADLVILGDPGGDAHDALIRAKRAGLRAVLRDGRPVVADPDLVVLFEASGVEAREVLVDGRRKLMAASALTRPAATLEPGLELA